MTPKEYLKQIEEYDNKIYMIEEQEEKILALLDARGISYKSIKVKTSGTDKTDIMAEYADIRKKNDEIRKEAARIRNKITGQICKMKDPLDAKILYMRYVNTFPLTLIAKKLGYSYDWIRHRHGTALYRFGKKFGPF